MVWIPFLDKRPGPCHVMTPPLDSSTGLLTEFSLPVPPSDSRKSVKSCDSVNMPPYADPGSAHEDVETTPESCIAELSNRLENITADAEPHQDAS